ncbi:ABC transporter ATP-binding protein [Natronoglycomyces albus]|uniref:ABC transporter ATP-binding protein n=1 Tax=Natronoglycomyces albus TaxID=2811108 RepID=A0A895XRP7_9ACTN|nr:ABC transporter ATP-binding protein [Natronoglycomyces albus]QSB05236.1 ABC transporter ATP-binding protein [Natronoglycomyces albus]
MSRSNAGAAVWLESVSKSYPGKPPVQALREVSQAFRVGTFTAIMGPSGSGKSTLLQCAAGLDRPQRGRVWLGDTDLTRLSEQKRTILRRQRIGFVFQQFNLMSALTVTQNVELPLRLNGTAIDDRLIDAALRQVGLAEFAHRRPAELSGGQQQRVAVARAVVTQPEVMFADEPTGALDLRSGREVLEIFRATVDESGQTIIMVTHDPQVASHADAVLFLADGRIVRTLPASPAEAIAAELTRITGPAVR